MGKVISREEAIRLLKKQTQTASFLRSGLPEFAYLLRGRFDQTTFNFYSRNSPLEEGVVISRPLLGDKTRKIPSTVGLILPAKESELFMMDFNTGDNIEELTVLQTELGKRKGNLNITVNPGSGNEVGESMLKKFGTIYAPANSNLHLFTTAPILYVCRYTPVRSTSR